MDNLNWFGKMILAIAFAVSFFATQGIMDLADAGTAKAPQVNTCKPIMADSTPLVFPYSTNVVINPTANWGLKDMTFKKAVFLSLPHLYQGKPVCVLDTRADSAAVLTCEAILGHGRHETFHAFKDGWVLYQVK
ncbi:hypothetical protein GL267_003045 [Acidithiobacillus ferrianus]|uniref:Uncharacterized protein n=2 Tax=Acidithiobacillus ferrianus TaxID=2678518 RepID=A0A845UFI3_9PROT|nr:hypothetical protein [Acidithiobacillus ferrianus]NDU43350.1 hypothetical protein [Acidithiobacillus ferrianus]